MQELDGEALGWFSRRLSWGSHCMLARTSVSVPTLDVALKRWCRHHGLLVGYILLKLAATDDVATLSMAEKRNLADLRKFFLVCVLRNILGVACWLAD